MKDEGPASGGCDVSSWRVRRPPAAAHDGRQDIRCPDDDVDAEAAAGRASVKGWAESEDEEGDEEGDALFCQREAL